MDTTCRGLQDAIETQKVILITYGFSEHKISSNGIKSEEIELDR